MSNTFKSEMKILIKLLSLENLKDIFAQPAQGIKMINPFCPSFCLFWLYNNWHSCPPPALLLPFMTFRERGLRFEPSPSLTRKVYDRNMLLEQTRRMNKTTTNLAAVVNPSLLLHPPSSSPSYHASSMTSSMSGTFSPSSLTSSSSNTYPM